MQMAIVADPAKCYACLTCVVECGYAKSGDREGGPLRAEVLSRARLTVEEAAGYAVPVVCHHCEDAPCMKVCPAGAVYRREESGPVLMDAAKCIGCKACILACPFGMARLSYEGRVAQKCDLCLGLLAPGEEPICVRSCPSRALQLVPVGEVVHRAAQRAARDLIEAELGAAADSPTSRRA